MPLAGIVTCAVILAHARWEALRTALAILAIIAALYFVMKPKAVIEEGTAESIHD